jgi:hypothetical protein
MIENLDALVLPGAENVAVQRSIAILPDHPETSLTNFEWQAAEG